MNVEVLKCLPETYTCYFYIYNVSKEDTGEDPYEESYKLTFDNLKDAIIATFKDANASEDCIDYGGAVVVDGNKAVVFDMLRNGDFEFCGGNKVIKIVEEYLQRDFSEWYK